MLLSYCVAYRMETELSLGSDVDLKLNHFFTEPN
ncbi:hypothetical protein VPHK251G3_0070 [Vibrio phage K251 g3]